MGRPSSDGDGNRKDDREDGSGETLRVNWLLGWFVTINGQSSIVVTAADGSNVKTVLTSACSMSKWLHSRLGFTCIDGNSVKVYTVNVAETNPKQCYARYDHATVDYAHKPSAGSPDGPPLWSKKGI